MRRHVLAFALGVATAGLLGACSDPSVPSEPSQPNVTAPDVLASRNTTCEPAAPDNEIPLPIAPPTKRVDLFVPQFSRPTSVTNPLFPISLLSQAILVGATDGDPLRIETTLMPKTLRVNLGDRVVESLASQFVSYVGRRIHEYALDRYVQADDGSVWYLGEDVFNYEDGDVVDTEGTWLACKDGPAAMIMPARPRVGDVFRTENAFPIVFEEVTVQTVSHTVFGPRGPVTGAMIAQELHQDGSLEAKTFAPSYGEFASGTPPANFEALALAVPTDALPGGVPADLRRLTSGARRVFHSARAGDWAGATHTVNAMNAAWARHQQVKVPPLLKPLMAAALNDVTQAVAQRDAAESRQAAVDVLRNGLDLELQYRSRIDVDVARLDLWVRQLVIDAQAKDAGGIASDVVILKWILDRLVHVGGKRDGDDAREVASELAGIRRAAERDDFAGALQRARRLLEDLAERDNGHDEGGERDR